MSACLFARCLRLFRLNVVSTDADCGTFPFYANLHNWGMKCKTLTKTKKLLQRNTLTGDFTTSMSLVPSSALFCLQNWHRFFKVLETFLTNFADLSVYVHDINLVFYHIPKVDWDRITAKASCIQRSHCHAWETSLRSFEVCDMVPYVRITLWCKGHCKRCSFKLWHLNDAHRVNLMATYQRWGSHHGVAKLILL